MNSSAKLKKQKFHITMQHMSFDTLKFAETLIAAGFSDSQAKALSKAQNEVFAEALDKTLATKADIQRLDNKIDSLETNLKADIQRLDNKIDSAIAEFNHKFTLLYWMGGFILSIQATILIKLFH